MGVAVTASTMLGCVTPTCNECGIALCWDIDENEYYNDREFWDAWCCEVCNGGKPMSLKEWKRGSAEGRHNRRIVSYLGSVSATGAGPVPSLFWRFAKAISRERGESTRQLILSLTNRPGPDIMGAKDGERMDAPWEVRMNKRDAISGYEMELRGYIDALDPADMHVLVAEIFNCREVDIDLDGSIWIADPQGGHWLSQDEREMLVRRISQVDAS